MTSQNSATAHPSLPHAVRTGLTLLALAAAVFVSPANAADDAAQMALGKQLFLSGAVPACAICHTLKDAESEGAIGPVFDELKPNAERVKKALMEGVGAMPSYAEKLTEQQMAALALYVSRASGGSK